MPRLAETTVKWPAARQDTALNQIPRFPVAERFAIRGLRAAGAMLIATSLIGTTMPASAQNVPIPKPAPKSRDIQMSASDSQRAPGVTGSTTTPPNPVIPDPRRNVPANIFSTFDANQKAQAARVSAYLSSLQTLVGNFIQVGPDGSVFAEGNAPTYTI